MSFAEDLWDNFDLVYNHNIDRRRGITQLAYLLKERGLKEDYYARELDKLGAHVYNVTNQGTLAHAVVSMKNDFFNKAQQSKLFAENIQTDLVDPINDLLKTQDNIIKKSQIEGKKIQKELNTLMDRHDKAKIRYLKACKETETVTIMLENSINLPGDRRNRLINKFVTCKKEIDESLKQYKSSVDAANDYKSKHDDMMDKILQIYQKHEETRLEEMKDALRKYVVYQTAYLRNMQYDVEQLSKSMEGINTEADIQQFITEHATEKPRLPALEFEAYQGTHPSYTNLGPNSPMPTIPHASPAAQTRSQPAPDLEILQREAALEVQWKGAMDEIMTKVYQNEQLSADNYAHFNIMVKERLGRKLWTGFIVNQRATNGPEISSEIYDALGNMSISLINEWERFKDIVMAKVILDLANAIYRMESHNKIYLSSSFKTHSLWKITSAWEEIIEISIHEEFRSYETYAQETHPDDILRRKKNLVFWLLGNFLHTMLSFDISRDVVSEMVSKYAVRFQLATEEIDTLMANIERFNALPVTVSQQTATEAQRGIPAWVQELEEHTVTSSKLYSKEEFKKLSPKKQEENVEEETTSAPVDHEQIATDSTASRQLDFEELTEEQAPDIQKSRDEEIKAVDTREETKAIDVDDENANQPTIEQAEEINEPTDPSDVQVVSQPPPEETKKPEDPETSPKRAEEDQAEAAESEEQSTQEEQTQSSETQ